MNSNDSNKQPLDIDEFLKEARFLKLTDDVAFKMYFKRNEKTLRSLLTNFLPLPKDSMILDIEVLDPELPPDQLATIGEELGKNFILDLRVRFTRTDPKKSSQTETVNVEMQTTSELYFTERTLAYSCRLYSQQLKKRQWL